MDLVTGGAGFIGSHLVRRLVREGRRVRVVDDLSTGRSERVEALPEVIEFVRADLATADLAPLVAGVDVIYHLAAIPSVPRSVRDPVATHGATATATLRLLVAARDAAVRRFVLSSSSSVYGDTPVSPKREELALRPLSPYGVAKGVAKVAAEAYARIFSSLFGLHTVSLRYFNIFGPDQDPTSAYAAVIPRFIGQAIAGEPLTIYGNGEQTRDFTFVENVVEANLAAARASVPSGRVYNIAAGEARSVNDLVAALERILGRRLDVTHGPERPGDIRDSHADIGSARAELGWAPHISFLEGLRHTVESYRSRVHVV